MVMNSGDPQFDVATGLQRDRKDVCAISADIVIALILDRIGKTNKNTALTAIDQIKSSSTAQGFLDLDDAKRAIVSCFPKDNLEINTPICISVTDILSNIDESSVIVPALANAVTSATVTINSDAKALLEQCAASHGVSLEKYLEAVANYTISCERRPGSWEASQPFDFSTYDDRQEVHADRWF